jgi:hypothetical protein
MIRRSKSTLAALMLAAVVYPACPFAISTARAEPAAQPSPADAKDTHADAKKHTKHHAPRGDDANRGASTSRRSDDPTRGRNTGDAKLSGPGSGAGL